MSAVELVERDLRNTNGTSIYCGSGAHFRCDSEYDSLPVLTVTQEYVEPYLHALYTS
jgi:hypothetical protein